MFSRRPPPNEASKALVDLQLANEGYDPEPPPIFRSPAPQPAPPGVQMEKPDWREEERKAAERDAAEELEPAQSLQSEPAKRKRKSKTPNMDKVREWFPKGAP